MLNFLLFDSANVGSFSHLAKKKHFARLAKLVSLAAAPSARSSSLPSLSPPHAEAVGAWATEEWAVGHSRRTSKGLLSTVGKRPSP